MPDFNINIKMSIVVGLLAGVYVGALFRDKYKQPSIELFQQALGQFKISDNPSKSSTQ